MADLHWMSVRELHDAYRKKTLSPVELVNHLLERIEKYDPAVHAFISLDAQRVRAAAAVAEKEICMAGPRSPLHGIPVGIKDMIDVAGERSSCHSRLAPSEPARQDAQVIGQLRQAGAIPFGRLSMHEYAIGGPSFDLPYPPARNPWNSAYHPGGSSSGSGVAVAAGFVPLALGTDTGGSIRNPAGACGIAGLKPTYERVSRKGVVPLSPTLDHVGPLARTVTDIALAMGSLVTPCRGYTDDARFVSTRSLNRPANDLKFGVVRHFHTEDLIADDEIIQMMEGVVRHLAGVGIAVAEVRLPSLLHFNAVQRIIFHAEPWSLHADNLRRSPQDYGHIARSKLMAGAFTSVEDYLQALALRRQLSDIVDAALRDVDILIVANALAATPPIEDAEECSRTYPLQARSAFNLTGHPAIALMSGLANGLPMSVQFVGRRGEDQTVLRAARMFERLAGFLDCHPPVPAV